jgi:beta-glucosidase
VIGERSGWFFDENGKWWPTVGERSDVQSLDLSGRQDELIRAVQETGTPTVVVLVNGRPLSVRWAAENVDAIVEAWLPGERGGQAIADVLFGIVDPGGRLSVTVPAHVGQLPVYYNRLPSKDYWYGFGGYVDSANDGRPLYPFGHGLSYTTFAYDDLSLRRSDAPGVVAEVSVAVRNDGTRAGTDVVQLYVRDRFSSVATPVKELRGFEKVRLAPGEQVTVRFVLSAGDLALLDSSHRLVVEPGTFDVMVGRSSDDIRLEAPLELSEAIRLPGAVPLVRTR